MKKRRDKKWGRRGRAEKKVEDEVVKKEDIGR